MDFPPQQLRLVAENDLSFAITDVQSINWASDEDEEAAEEGGVEEDQMEEGLVVEAMEEEREKEFCV
ncbi:hypothetical protein Pyn_31815 [Prunus yedoensis var. nudiflora]|uniref:Uncharacterized protein n=1 Tax=Prunus yedoensis var. nudiflora TaxID=2094558 RepID=A0A314V4R3_PRUYE|nr:hypothetical protein Pyn_31815 [Prunus yedoensis var. nudiflora]